MAMPRVREVLNDYAAQRASNEAVVRAFLEHDGWQMPLEQYAQSSPPGAELVAPRVVLLGQASRVPPRHVLLFTDDEMAREAAADLGAVAAGLGGVDVMRRALALDPERIIINVASRREDAFTIILEPRARGLLGLWIAAIDVEQRAARGAWDDPATRRALREYGGFVSFVYRADESVVTLPGHGGLDNAAVLFTTPDSAQAFLSRLLPDAQQGIERLPIDGATWFARIVADGGVDGVLLNPFGPGKPVALPLDVCRTIAAEP